MIHRYNRNIKRRRRGRCKGGEFGGDTCAGIGGRQHSERDTGKNGGLRATHELHKEKRQWLLKPGETDATVAALTEFVALRYFVVKNQSTIIRGYLAAIN